MLLEARKTAPLDRLYAAYGRRLLRRTFAAVWLGGAPRPDDGAPAIAVLNHSAWWDPIVALFLSHDLFRRDGYGIMQGAQLERFPFFRRVGCFGTTSDSLRDARNLADYAARVLRGGARRALRVFPQGALLPARGPGALTRCLERRVAAELRRLDADLERPGAAGYACALRGRASVSEWYERVTGTANGE